jgi:hypothetical protein
MKEAIEAHDWPGLTEFMPGYLGQTSAFPEWGKRTAPSRIDIETSV